MLLIFPVFSFILQTETNKKVNLVIDIGNTAAKIAVFERENPIEVIRSSHEQLNQIDDLLKRYPIQRALLSTVVTLPQETEDYLAQLPIPLLRLTAQTPLPMKLCYKTPETLGPDRIAVCIEAAAVQPGHDLLVIDAGTCITYEFVSSKGEYLGGNISPGLEMRLKALNQFTSKLPLVDPHGDVPMAGYNTETAIRSGVINGIRHEIEGYIHQLRAKKPNLLVFLTGGNILNFDTNVKNGIFADELLLLKGLNRILNYNENR